MKIAITGGAGFIGTRLRALLEEAGHESVTVDIRHDNPVDILDLPALIKATEGCDAIYHLAAEHADNVFPRSRYYDVNVKGTANVCAAADVNGIRKLIFTSSFAVYGLNANLPNETATPAPFNDYGQSKLEGEEVLRNWAAANADTRLTIVRPVVVFGEGNRGNVYNLIRQMQSGRFVMVGKGNNKKSMAYVGNVAAFLQHCLTFDHHEDIFNYADKPDLSMSDLTALVRQKLGGRQQKFSLPYPIGLAAGHIFDAASRVTGRTFPISAVRIQKFCADTTSDASKAHAVFTPPFTMANGFARFVAHDFAPAKDAA